MIKSIVFPSLKNALITLLFVGILFFNSVNSAWAKRPPEIRNQQDLNLEPDMHGQDLSGNEYVKFDLNGFNFSESNLEGAVFNNSKLQNSKFTGANLRDALAYATDFTDADLSDVNFTNALLMKNPSASPLSVFTISFLYGSQLRNASYVSHFPNCSYPVEYKIFGVFFSRNIESQCFING